MDLEDITTITVLGAGTMGHGIAEIAALSGYTVRLRDIEEEIVQEGYDQIKQSLETTAEKGYIGEDERDAALENVTPVVDIEEAVDETDVVIEAIIEEMSIKKDVYQELEEYAPERTIFASNTSSLSITDLSEVTERPEKFLGMHFFNPPTRMDLVEVIRGAHTSDETMDLIEELSEDIGKTPVRVQKDEPGFIVNRILIPMLNEAAWIVDSGDATVEEVDSTTTQELGLPMGAFELGDVIGNDVSLHILDYMEDVLGAAYEPCPLLVQKVDDDELGRKTGIGFYDYADGPGADYPDDAVSEDVAHRLYGVMANEAGKLLEKEVAPADDIDTAVKLGAGFPEGPATMADDVGVETLIETLEDLSDETGAARYAVADGLRTVADQGGFYGGDE